MTCGNRLLSLSLIAGLGIWLSCADLERSNPLDPKNPDSFTKQVVLAELFVNDSIRVDGDTTGSVYQASAYAEAALESLYLEFSSLRLVYVQYHVGNVSHDSLDVVSNFDYYKTYASANRAVPDVFINGPAARIQGASSIAMVYGRMREAITRVLDQRSAFGIEGSFSVDTAAQTIAISAQIIRLGNADSPGNLKVQYSVANDLGIDDHHLTVCYITTVNLPVIAHGDRYHVPAQTIPNPRKIATGSTALMVCIKDDHEAVVQAKLILGAQE